MRPAERGVGFVKPSVWMRLDGAARQLTPFGSVILLTIITVIPLDLPVIGAVSPVWPLIGVYVWSLLRPDLFPAAAAFAAGLLYDALSGAPIGVNAAVFVVAHLVVSGERQRLFFYGKPFALVWFGFAIILFGALLFGWLLSSAWYGALLPARILVLQYLVTLGVFPLAAWALYGWRRLILRQV